MTTNCVSSHSHSGLLPLLLIISSLFLFVQGTSHLSLRYANPSQEFHKQSGGEPRVPGLFPGGGFPFGGGGGGANGAPPPQAPQFNVTFVEDPSGGDGGGEASVSETLEMVVQILRMIAELASLLGMGNNAVELLSSLGMFLASLLITATLMAPLLLMMPLALLLMTFAFLLPLRHNNPFTLGRSLHHQSNWEYLPKDPSHLSLRSCVLKWNSRRRRWKYGNQ